MSWRKDQADRIDAMANVAPDTRPISRMENQFWKAATIPVEGTTIPEGWELWVDDDGNPIERPGALHPLIINRNDPRTPIGTYIQWAPRRMADPKARLVHYTYARCPECHGHGWRSRQTVTPSVHGISYKMTMEQCPCSRIVAIR